MIFWLELCILELFLVNVCVNQLIKLARRHLIKMKSILPNETFQTSVWYDYVKFCMHGL